MGGGWRDWPGQTAICRARGRMGKRRPAPDRESRLWLTAMPEQGVRALDVARLVRRAASGDRWAWERLVDQYARLVWAMTRDFRLAESDAADVAQATWLRLLEHIDRLECPDRVGSWLAATARHECLRSLAARKKLVLVNDDVALHRAAAHEPGADERILADERAQVVREALSRLPRPWQRLLELLMADPPASHAQISDQLGLPVGSIGPAGVAWRGCAYCCRPPKDRGSARGRVSHSLGRNQRSRRPPSGRQRPRPQEKLPGPLSASPSGGAARRPAGARRAALG